MRAISVENLVQPYFVLPGKKRKEKIESMPGIFRWSVDNLIKEVAEAKKLGISAVLLFGIPERKDFFGSEAFRSDGVVQNAVRALKEKFPDLTVITDVCLCAYTTHGHCAILRSEREVAIDLKSTLETLSRIAVSYAEAGADMVAPSAMMKRQVKAIRGALDKNNFKKVKIMGYSAKFASSFYGPFREALDSAPAFGDRRGYQLDYRSAAGALKEIEADIKEGADIVMVKPALAYLDIIYQAKQKFKVPMAAYNVSGEYAIIRNQEMVLEVLAAIKRAGADIIITYHAKEIAKII